MQPLIMGWLKAVCDYMGIKVTREERSANGNIDFQCTYTYNNEILKTCLEIKNAHATNNKLELGLTKQLPEYLKSERTKYGIYLVLWYKGKNFDKANGFESPEELVNSLNKRKPKDFKIDIIVIDCNKPIVPSKL